MEKAILKKEIENMLDDLPDDANWDDLMYNIYVRQSIEQGLEDSKAGRTVSHDDIKNKYQQPKRELIGQRKPENNLTKFLII